MNSRLTQRRVQESVCDTADLGESPDRSSLDPPEPKKPKLDTEVFHFKINTYKGRINLESTKQQLEDLQRAREANFKRGNAILFEFWTNPSNSTMSSLVKLTQCCSYLYHLNRKYVHKLLNLRLDNFKKDPTRPFLVRDYEFPLLTVLGCGNSDLCIDKIPFELPQEQIDTCHKHLESFSLPEAEDEQTLIRHLSIIRKDYTTTINERAAFLAIAQDAGLIIRTYVRFDKFYNSVEPVLKDFGFSTDKSVGDLKEMEASLSLNAAFVFYKPYIKALFQVLDKQGFIVTQQKQPDVFWLHLGHSSQGPFCCHTGLSKQA